MTSSGSGQAGPESIVYMSIRFDIASSERTELIVRSVENSRDDSGLKICAKHITIFDDQMLLFSVVQYE